MRKWLNKQWKRRPQPARWLWKWANEGGPKKTAKRFKALTRFAMRRQHEAARRAHAADRRAREAKTHIARDKAIHERKKAWASFRRWNKARPIYHRQQRKAHRRWKRNQKPDEPPGYAEWMLSGHGSNIDDDLKPVVAFLVVVRRQTISDTYDFSGHTPSSMHYPRNDPTSPQQGRAVDAYGPDMCGSQEALIAKFGYGKFVELFGPCPWWVKNGTRYSGYFPGHGDHTHSGVA